MPIVTKVVTPGAILLHDNEALASVHIALNTYS